MEQGGVLGSYMYLRKKGKRRTLTRAESPTAPNHKTASARPAPRTACRTSTEPADTWGCTVRSVEAEGARHTIRGRLLRQRQGLSYTELVAPLEPEKLGGNGRLRRRAPDVDDGRGGRCGREPVERGRRYIIVHRRRKERAPRTVRPVVADVLRGQGALPGVLGFDCGVLERVRSCQFLLVRI